MAQSAISNLYFPSVGDTLALARASDSTAKLLSITPAADNQIWDYSFLDSISSTTERYEAIPDSTKLAFPEGDLIATIGGQQAVFNKTDTRFEILGFKNIRFQNLFFPINFTPDNPILQRRASLEYITVNNNRSVGIAVLSPSQLPDSVVNKLLIRPDSVRITLTNIRQDYVDAWGTLAIPKGTYPVLRQRCIEINEQRLEAKINNNWLDVTPQYFNGNTNPQDTTITYNFWSEGIKAPILRIVVNDKNQIKRAEYRIESPKRISVSGTVRFWKGQGLQNVVVKIGTDSVKTNANGQFRFANIEIGKNLSINLSKSDNYENGVDAADIILIRRHIVGISEFDSKFKLFAGDVDGNNDIDAADIIFIRRLIVGINDVLPNTTAWRFVSSTTAEKANFPFPLKDTFPYILTFEGDTANLDFYGVKKGDVDGSAQR